MEKYSSITELKRAQQQDLLSSGFGGLPFSLQQADAGDAPSGISISSLGLPFGGALLDTLLVKVRPAEDHR
jgi:hypothetical protein